MIRYLLILLTLISFEAVSNKLLVSADLIIEQEKVLEEAVQNLEKCLENANRKQTICEDTIQDTKSKFEELNNKLLNDLFEANWKLERLRQQVEYYETQTLFNYIMRRIHSIIEFWTSLDGDFIKNSLQKSLSYSLEIFRRILFEMLAASAALKIKSEKSFSIYLHEEFPLQNPENIDMFVQAIFLGIPSLILAFFWHRLTTGTLNKIYLFIFPSNIVEEVTTGQVHQVEVVECKEINEHVNKEEDVVEETIDDITSSIKILKSTLSSPSSISIEEL